MITHIYSKYGILLDSLHSPKDYKEKFNEYFPQYEGKDIIVSEVLYANPTVENGEIREKTKEELVGEGQVSLLNDGEFYENDKIHFVSIPPTIFNPKWDNVKNEWVESATLAELQSYFMSELQKYMDKKADTYGFDNVFNAASYSNSKVEKFKNDAETILDWRDSVWDNAYSIMEKVLTGQRPIPTLEELINELPQLEDGGVR